MTPENFCEQFATFAEAPNGIAKLRELILQLAVQGKLVPHDVNDEPVEDLLRRLGLHRAPPTTEPSSRNSGAAFADLPSSWAVVSLDEIANIVYGKNLPTSQLKADGFPVFGANGVIGCYDRFLYETSQLLISCRGAYSGKINMSPPKAFITNNSLVVELFVGLEPAREYLFHALAAIDRTAMITGTAQPQVTVGNAVQLRIPLPPLAEQRRIVGKVDQLLGLCDELAARQAARREARSALVGATLDRLVSARSAAEFPAHAHRLRDHFDRLFDTPTTIPQLRQAILQLAVQGQLVPRDPNDEPASQTFRDVDELGAGVDRNVFVTGLSTMSVPTNWAVAPLASVSETIVDCPHSTPKWTPSGKMCVRTNQFRAGRLDLSDVQFVSEATFTERIQRLKPATDDILYSREGGILGIACRVPPGVELCLGQRMMLIRSGTTTDPAFLELVLNSPLITDIALGRTTGGAAPRVNVATVKAYPIPVPPLSEQKRIVSKVTELLSLCDALEAKLTQAESASTQLLAAAVHHLLNRGVSNG